VSEAKRRIGPILVLAVSALLVMCVFAYGTVNNWFAFATGDVYEVDEGAAPAADEPVQASPSPAVDDDADYQAGSDKGRKDGYKRGYARGRKAGFRHGYKVGVRKGMKITQGQGYDAGYPAGERAGRKAGVKKLNQDYAAWKASR